MTAWGADQAGALPVSCPGIAWLPRSPPCCGLAGPPWRGLRESQGDTCLGPMLTPLASGCVSVSDPHSHQVRTTAASTDTALPRRALPLGPASAVSRAAGMAATRGPEAGGGAGEGSRSGAASGRRALHLERRGAGSPSGLLHPACGRRSETASLSGRPGGGTLFGTQIICQSCLKK